VYPKREEVQLKRSWWREEKEARNRGWLRNQLERGWIMDRWVVTIVECVDCGSEGKWEEIDQEQGHLLVESFRNNRCLGCQENWEAGQWEVSRGNVTQVQCVECRKTDAVPGKLSMEEICHLKCAQCVDKEEQKAREVVQPREVKVQPKGEVKVERDVRRTVKIITEVWMKVGIEKLDNHKGVIVKALLDSGATRVFADQKFVEKYGFKMQKLYRPVNVKNVDGTKNSGEMITYEIEMNIFLRDM